MKFPFLSHRSNRPISPRFTPIEKLEARIAPAVLVNAKTLTYTDIDGDLVTVTISKGTLTAADFVFNNAFGSDGAQQLQLLDFAGDKDKADADVSITAVTVAHAVGNGMAVGNGAVNVGYVNATGIDLGKVIVDGDLGRLDAGDATLTTPGVKRIEVGSMGALGVTTQAAGGNLTSNITGPVNALVVTGGVQEATLLVKGAIASIDIGGGITGGDADQSGAIRARGSIDLVHVGLDLHGGSGAESGQIFSSRNIGTVVIDGSIIGGDVAGLSVKSGMVLAGGTIDQAVVGHDIVGGAGMKSGQIASRAGMGGVQISGSVRGGAGFQSGAIGSGGPISSISITNDLIGYQNFSDTGESNGALLSSSTIGRVTIGGNIEGGTNLHSGVIGTEKGLGTVTVQGSVFGRDGQESGAIGSNGPIRSVKIVGDLDGGEGNQSGRVVSKKSIDSVLVQGSVFGGGGDGSGAIGALGVVKSVRVEGNMFGNNGLFSGRIGSEKKLVSVTVVGALGSFSGGVGFAATNGNGGPGNAFGAGQISAPVINKVTVGAIGSAQNSFDPGSIQGGAIGTITITDSIYSSFFVSAFISARSIGTMTVANNVVGQPLFSKSSTGPVEIDVRNSLGSLTVGGDVTNLEVVVGGGFDSVEGPANPDAQVGKITVSGDWSSSIVAVGTFAGNDGIFGTLDDKIASGGNPNIVSTIARIQIDGTISNAASQGSNPFGFLAQHITALVVEGETVPLKAGASNDSKFLSFEASVFVRENNALLD